MKKSLLILLSLLTLILFAGCANSDSDVITIDQNEEIYIPEASELECAIKQSCMLYFYGDRYYLNLDDAIVPIALEKSDYFINWYDNDYIYVMDRDKKAFKISLTEPYGVSKFKIKKSMFRKWGDFPIFAPGEGQLEFLLDEDMHRYILLAPELYELGDLIIAKTEPSDMVRYNVYDKSFKCIADFFCTPRTMPKSKLLIPFEQKYCLYNKKGKLLYESREYDKVLVTVDSMVLVVDDGQVKLIDLKENEITTFFQWNEDMYFYDMMTGYFEPENADAGYYFVFLNQNLESDEHHFAYCYSQKTGKVTRYPIDNILQYILIPD